MIVHEDTMRLMVRMYDQHELPLVLKDLEDSDGWLIIPFNKCPILEPIDDLIPRMISKVIMQAMLGISALPDYRLN